MTTQMGQSEARSSFGDEWREEMDGERDGWRREDEEGIGIQRLGSRGWGREEETGVLRGRKKTCEARKAEVYIENKPENFT